MSVYIKFMKIILFKNYLQVNSLKNYFLYSFQYSEQQKCIVLVLSEIYVINCMFCFQFGKYIEPY